MLDLARVVVLLVAIASAVRHRFIVGVVFGVVLAGVFAGMFCVTYAAMNHGAVSGEYAVALAYVGPTMVPLGSRSFWQWSPAVVQCALALISAVPAMRALREPSHPVTIPFLAVFVPNAMLAVLASLAAFLLWRQENAFPEYWQDHL
jgi:hypothetical protein